MDRQLTRSLLQAGFMLLIAAFLLTQRATRHEESANATYNHTSGQLETGKIEKKRLHAINKTQRQSERIDLTT